MNRLKDDPFFLAVGFYKPHLPFNAPKKYWDLYNREEIPLAPHPAPPENVDISISLHKNGELTGRYEALKDPTDATPEEARCLRHGYFACVSYVDAQIGKLLDELERLDLRKNTIVVVWGDPTAGISAICTSGANTPRLNGPCEAPCSSARRGPPRTPIPVDWSNPSTYTRRSPTCAACLNRPSTMARVSRGFCESRIQM
ncbi:MAG: sulfatase-like hydrolase/transferase, partial [Candidatus Hydrogenedentes bacterium]|nr:sulfatase-like hydrolase/transferase [Candidatus Hydrogenedentota bacterium]